MEYVYFISSDDKIKIGYTKNIKRRLKQLQTSNSSQLLLLGYIEGDKDVEKQLHKRFAQYRIRKNGEWFNCSDEILDYINEYNLEPNIKVVQMDGKIYPCLSIQQQE